MLGGSWYASADNIKAGLGLSHHFIFALESTRTVAVSEAERKQGAFKSLNTIAFLGKTPLLVYPRSVKEAVLVVKQVFLNKDGSEGNLYLVSSDLSLDYEQITTIYQRRWKVREYHKSLKQNTSMGSSPTKTPDTQANHFFATILAYIKLEALKTKCAIEYFRLKAQLYAVGLKAMHQQLTRMSA